MYVHVYDSCACCFYSLSMYSSSSSSSESDTDDASSSSSTSSDQNTNCKAQEKRFSDMNTVFLKVTGLANRPGIIIKVVFCMTFHLSCKVIIVYENLFRTNPARWFVL